MWGIDGKRTFNTKSASDVANRETSSRACTTAGGISYIDHAIDLMLRTETARLGCASNVFALSVSDIDHAIKLMLRTEAGPTLEPTRLKYGQDVHPMRSNCRFL